jgi:hypothetical protein
MTDRAGRPPEEKVVDADLAPPERPSKQRPPTSERRSRPAKGGATLVRPSTPSESASEDDVGAEEADATERAIQAATDTSTLPEQAVKSDGANGKLNGNGRMNGSANGKAAQNGHQNGQTSRTGAARPATGQRKPGAKGQSAARARNNRPKGGR